MTPEQATIWARMPAKARERIGAVPLEFRSLLVEIWDVVDRKPRVPDDDPETDMDLVAVQAALEGRASNPGEREVYERAQKAIEGRLSRMRDVTGYQTLAALQNEDPKTFDRFMAGCVRALRRVRLIIDGDISYRELGELKRFAAGAAVSNEFEASLDDAEGWR